MIAPTMKHIDLVYFNYGGGHRAAALALQSVIRERKRGWNVRLVDLVEVIDPQGAFRKLTGLAPEDLYNKRLARGWTLGLRQELKLLHGLIRLGHATLVRRLAQHWLASEPDLVVSLVPNFNRALCESVAGSLPGVPFVTVLTDMADHPPNFWIEPGQDQHLVCGTQQAVAQARAAGYADEQISLTSGMILRPAFYASAPLDRAAERRALGLDPARPTGVVMFGGQGSTQMAGIARALSHEQLILMCGHNEVLIKRLRAQRPGAPHAVVGFTPDVGRYMQLGDYFIGKPGPGSLSEALQMKLPVITFDNAWTMPQERYNVQWVREQGVGLVLQSVRALRPGVAEMIERLPELRARVRKIDNRAVFEVPEILADLLYRAAIPQAAGAALGLSAADALASARARFSAQ
jgi:UDP-N-acetylglucosamine:LPS N-acetylglucosamine transferase